MTTRKRARTTTGTLKPDDKSTPEVNEAWDEAPTAEVETPETSDHAEEAEAPAEEAAAPVEEVVAKVVDDKAPVVTELQKDVENSTLRAPQDPADIQAKIKSKLASRSEEEMFNPAATVAASKGQIEAVAEQNGFELTRGREIGARLLARRAANQR